MSAFVRRLTIMSTLSWLAASSPGGGAAASQLGEFAARPPTATAVQIRSTRQKGSTANAQFARDMKTCMGTWDRFTQMTKTEWRQTCRRTLKTKEFLPLDELKPE
jgi:hypothetical protein